MPISPGNLCPKACWVNFRESLPCFPVDERFRISGIICFCSEDGVLFDKFGFGIFWREPSSLRMRFPKIANAFGAESPGCRFTVQQRVATCFYKHGSVGFMCGLIGQGNANMILNAKKSIMKSEEDIPVFPLLQSAALCGCICRRVFLH
ncbi:hypothetical protein MLD38_017249 [Melastoma candidum]|uniref:Uncharacterized protein n=1 Tax=Melastoma candidum TaxID=119954 RepID=A0ACB9QQ09_9MYRT|nr:hypothetical protein MLD38_017249 [Melastoma candidum]